MKLMRFGVTGGLSALTLMGLTQVAANSFGKQIAFLAAYPVALSVHFCLNKWWTFKSHEKVNAKQFRDYGLLALATFLIQWSVFTALTTWTHLPLTMATLSSIAAQLAVSFFMMDQKVFASSNPSARE